MAQIYGLLRDDGSLICARKIAGGVEPVADVANVSGKEITVFVLGTNVLSLTASVNARNEAEARRAAPYAIEDEVGEAVENLHVSLGPKGDDAIAMRRMLVTSKSDMDGIVSALQAARLDDAAVIAAHSILPVGNTLISTGCHVLGRLGERSFVLEASIGADVFGGLIRDHPDITVLGEPLARDLGLAVSGHGFDDDTALLEALIGWQDEAPAINLRQGAYEVRRASSLGDIKRWRLAGVLAATALAGWFALSLSQTRAMQARTETLNARIAEFTAAGWPEANGDAAQAEVMARATRGTAPAGFPAALDAIASLYDSLTGVEATELRSLRYDRARGMLRAVVAYEQFADGDALVSALSRDGLNVSLGEARQSGAKVVSEITLEAAR